jgi:hypothetical protein
MQLRTNQEIKSVTFDSMRQIFSLEEISEDIFLFVWNLNVNCPVHHGLLLRHGHER